MLQIIILPTDEDYFFGIAQQLFVTWNDSLHTEEKKIFENLLEMLNLLIYCDFHLLKASKRIG